MIRDTTGPIVFLHIPKTAGQTIHNELCRIVGDKNVSPIRVHTQAETGPQMPKGFHLYSGHLDWLEISQFKNPFVFSVLRDPRERIASFYFYLCSKAKTLSREALSAPQNIGLFRASRCSAAEYFFGGDPTWQRFILDHYDNFYCNYFASQKMRGRFELAHFTPKDRMAQALENSAKLSRIYPLSELPALEADIHAYTGHCPAIACSYVNEGAMPRGQARWPKLLQLLERDQDIAQLSAFADADDELISRLGLDI